MTSQFISEEQPVEEFESVSATCFARPFKPLIHQPVQMHGLMILLSKINVIGCLVPGNGSSFGLFTKRKSASIALAWMIQIHPPLRFEMAILFMRLYYL